MQKKKKKEIDLCTWLGGTCNCEVGEGFDRWRLALGNNSDFFEEQTPLAPNLAAVTASSRVGEIVKNNKHEFPNMNIVKK